MSAGTHARQNAVLGSVTATENLVDRRSEPRYPTDGPAEIKFLDLPRARVLDARMVDVSKCGLRVRLGEELRAGSRVRVKFGDTLAFARVRWCRAFEEGHFDAGLEIEHTMARTLVRNLQRSGSSENQTTDEEPDK